MLQPVVGRPRAVAVTGEVDLLLGVLADIADDQVARCPVKGKVATDCAARRPRSPDAADPGSRTGCPVGSCSRRSAGGRSVATLPRSTPVFCPVVVGIPFVARRPRRRCRDRRPARTAAAPPLWLDSVWWSIASTVRALAASARSKSFARAPVLNDPDVAGAVGVVDVEPAIGLVVRRECHRQQSLLLARRS